MIATNCTFVNNDAELLRGFSKSWYRWFTISFSMISCLRTQPNSFIVDINRFMIHKVKWSQGLAILVEFGHLTKTNAAYFQKLLLRHKYFVHQIKDRLVGTADYFCSIVNCIAMYCVSDDFVPYFRRKMGIRHNGMGSQDKYLFTGFTEKSLFPAFMSLTDDSPVSLSRYFFFHVGRGVE